jgi:DNA transformation protein
LATRSEFIDLILDLLEGFGQVSARRMFGGHGIFREGLMFAIVADDVLYLKADDDNRAEFTGRGMQPFYYEKQGRQQMISYYQVPEEVFDDAAEMCAWAQQAYAAALRSGSKKRKKSPVP